MAEVMGELSFSLSNLSGSVSYHVMTSYEEIHVVRDKGPATP